MVDNTLSLIEKLEAIEYRSMRDAGVNHDALEACQIARGMIRQHHTAAPDYHAATTAYVRLGFDKDGKIIECNIYDLIKQVVDAAIEPCEISDAAKEQSIADIIYDNVSCADCESGNIEGNRLAAEQIMNCWIRPIKPVSVEVIIPALRKFCREAHPQSDETFARNTIKTVLDAAGVKYVD